MSLLHFLLIYDHSQQKLIDVQRFGEEGDRAAEAYSECEEKYGDRQDIEIVLVAPTRSKRSRERIRIISAT